ncbi:MAG: TetR/AcrR family transcriptional regulator [Streptococcus sp.]|nr:TetR/AcrR family transcriptional regulator [Streptococcus sp.]
MVINTRNKIVNALIELAEKYPDKSHFTFSEIAKQAGLSRQAIYKKHFSNVEDITDYIRQIIMEPFLPLYQEYEQDRENNPLLYFAQEIIPTIYKHRKWIRVLYTTAIDPFWKEYLTNFFTQWVEQNLEINSKKLGFPENMGTEVFVSWMNSLIEVWIIKEEPIPAEEFSQLFLKTASIPMSQFIEIPTKK